jgi:hypothetical protein
MANGQSEDIGSQYELRGEGWKRAIPDLGCVSDS